MSPGPELPWDSQTFKLTDRPASPVPSPLFISAMASSPTIERNECMYANAPEKRWRSWANTWCASHGYPQNCDVRKIMGQVLLWLPHVLLPHQPTPMRGLQMVPYPIKIIPSIKAIPTHGMAACNDSVVIHGCKTTCLLASWLTPIWTSKCSTSWLWSTSWTWTIVMRWAWAFFLYWLRVFWFRFFLASEFGCVWGGVGGEGFDCWTGPTCWLNTDAKRLRMLLVCSAEKPGKRT